MSKTLVKILILVFSIALTTLNVRYVADTFYPVNDAYLSNATKSFDAENSYSDISKWRGGRDRCFSCTRDLVDRYGLAAGSFGQPGRCFHCSRQRLTPNGFLQ